MNLNDLFILRKDKQISILTVLYVPQSEESSQHLCHGMPRRFSLLDVQLISHTSLIGARQNECLVVNIFLSVLSSVYQLLNRVATNDKFVIKNQNMKITNVNFISLPDRYILQLLRTQEKTAFFFEPKKAVSNSEYPFLDIQKLCPVFVVLSVPDKLCFSSSVPLSSNLSISGVFHSPTPKCPILQPFQGTLPIKQS